MKNLKFCFVFLLLFIQTLVYSQEYFFVPKEVKYYKVSLIKFLPNGKVEILWTREEKGVISFENVVGFNFDMKITPKSGGDENSIIGAFPSKLGLIDASKSKVDLETKIKGEKLNIEILVGEMGTVKIFLQNKKNFSPYEVIYYHTRIHN